ncbi:MAG: ethanolamine utilization protein EutH, partial [Clostridia bacterium]|nr:ethanolamine utilization protein EutH [Clostridia bacterium]
GRKGDRAELRVCHFGGVHVRGHLAFTLAFDAAYIVPVILGKLLAGITALLLAVLIHRRIAGRGSKLL